jgi:hypothetical protein
VTLEELRQRRRQLQDADDAISYVRRVAQGRADLARAELARRRDGAAAEDREAEVRDVLADRLLGGPGRPPRPVEDWSDHPRTVELDRLCADHGYGRLLELDADELTELVGVLDEFEAAVSAERRTVERQLDELTDQFIVAYQQETAQG